MEEQKAKWVFDQGGFSKALVVRVGTPEGRLASLQDDRCGCFDRQWDRV